MNATDRFWINFGKSIAWGMLLAVVIAIIELISPTDVARFPWAKGFGLKDFFSLLGVVVSFFGLLGVAIGIADNENRKSGFIRR